MNKKEQSELYFWKKLYGKFTKGISSQEDRDKICLDIAQNTTFERYKSALCLNDDSFIDMKVLDVGCGANGGLIGFKGCEKHAIDHLYNEYVKIGYPLSKHGIKYLDCSCEELPYEDMSFDRVLCVNALDHVDSFLSVENSIREISRVLKSGGLFLSQLNFRDAPTICEPIIFNHRMLRDLFNKHSMVVDAIASQPSKKSSEDRFYYKVIKQ
jgi:ubiquinone/menaquinone biosynthesis C-methylase UbiE